MRIQIFCLVVCFVFVAVVFPAVVFGQSSDEDDDDTDDDKCDPTIADTCFADVTDDLRVTFDPVNNFLQATNESALIELCNAWIDSLSCTSDIIDTSCSDQEGRLQFDSWNEGLKRVVDYLCLDDRNNLKAIADTVHCWSVLEFLQCVERTAGLVSIASLLNTPLNKGECDLLENSIEECNLKATNLACHGHPIVSQTLDGAKLAFFSRVNCNETAKAAEMTLGNGAACSGAIVAVAPLVGALFSVAWSRGDFQ